MKRTKQTAKADFGEKIISTTNKKGQKIDIYLRGNMLLTVKNGRIQHNMTLHIDDLSDLVDIMESGVDAEDL